MYNNYKMSGSNFNIDPCFDQLSDSSIVLDTDMTSQGSLTHISNPSSAASSVPNTDEEDDDNHGKMQKYKERRREAHTQAEKKRRDAIRKGYDDLQTLVPNLVQQTDPLTSQKLSKAVILQRTLSYVEYLQQQKKKQTEELIKLRKEKVALAIMKANYEQIVKQQVSNTSCDGKVSEETKFTAFQMMMDKLFESFNATVSTDNFQTLSHGVINWIEEECKPGNLKKCAHEVLVKMNSETQQLGQ